MNRIALLLMIPFCLLFSSLAGQKFTYEIKVKNQKIIVDIENSSEVNYVIWLKDWRLIIVDKQDTLLFGLPYLDHLKNYLFLYPQEVNLEKTFSKIDAYEYGFINSKSLKNLAPGQTFRFVINTNKKTIKTIRKKKLSNCALIIGAAEASVLDSALVDQLPKDLFYKESVKEVNLENSLLEENKDREFFRISRRKIRGLFQSFFLKTD